MKPSHWTVQVFPADSGASRSYQIKPRSVYLGVGTAVLLLGVVAAAVLNFFGQRHAMHELERYTLENRHLVASLGAMEQRTERLGRELDHLAARDQRFRVVAGLPLLDPEVYSVGVGGPVSLDAAREQFYGVAPHLAQSAQRVSLELDQMVRRAELLSASLGEAADSVERRREEFGRRPTIFPVMSASSWISSSFSYSRLHPLLGYRRPHPGIDISAPLGSPVIAAGAGRVVEAGGVSGYGKLVEIEHGDGFRSRYAHLATIAVRRGDVVARGALLGEVGRTGLTTGPNLHYEILLDDRQVDPRAYLLDDNFRR